VDVNRVDPGSLKCGETKKIRQGIDFSEVLKTKQTAENSPSAHERAKQGREPAGKQLARGQPPVVGQRSHGRAQAVAQGLLAAGRRAPRRPVEKPDRRRPASRLRRAAAGGYATGRQ